MDDDARFFFTMYVSTSTTNQLVIDVREEGVDPADWDAYTADEKSDFLDSLFHSYMSNLCDRGWYQSTSEEIFD